MLIPGERGEHAGGPSAFCQSRWSGHTWIQDVRFSPREKGCARCCLVSFSVGGLVWLLNFRGGLEREWPTTTVSPSEVRKGVLWLVKSRQAGPERWSVLGHSTCPLHAPAVETAGGGRCWSGSTQNSGKWEWKPGAVGSGPHNVGSAERLGADLTLCQSSTITLPLPLWSRAAPHSCGCLTRQPHSEHTEL